MRWWECTHDIIDPEFYILAQMNIHWTLTYRAGQALWQALFEACHFIRYSQQVLNLHHCLADQLTRQESYDRNAVPLDWITSSQEWDWWLRCRKERFSAVCLTKEMTRAFVLSFPPFSSIFFFLFCFSFLQGQIIRIQLGMQLSCYSQQYAARGIKGRHRIPSSA